MICCYSISLVAFVYIFLKGLFICIVCVWVCACVCVCAPPFCLMSVKLRKAWEPGGTNGCKSPHGCWEPNMGSLKEQYTLLTSVYNPCLHFLDCVHWHQKVSILIILKLIFSFFFLCGCQIQEDFTLRSGISMCSFFCRCHSFRFELMFVWGTWSFSWSSCMLTSSYPVSIVWNY